MVDLEIVDTSGNPVAHDGQAQGEIVARAPWLTQSYFKQPDKGEELWEGGWLHTGDVASMEPNHVLTIKDRIKDVIKTGGEWLSSLDLENLISQHAAVAGAAVVGIPDEKWGERPYALINLKPGENATAEDIQSHLQSYVDNGEINKWAIPTRIDFAEDIPKTSVGKINKKLIRDQLK